MSPLQRIVRARNLVDAALSELTRAPAVVYPSAELYRLRDAHAWLARLAPAWLARLIFEGDLDDAGPPDTMPSNDSPQRGAPWE